MIYTNYNNLVLHTLLFFNTEKQRRIFHTNGFFIPFLNHLLAITTFVITAIPANQKSTFVTELYCANCVLVLLQLLVLIYRNISRYCYIIANNMKLNLCLLLLIVMHMLHSFILSSWSYYQQGM